MVVTVRYPLPNRSPTTDWDDEPDLDRFQRALATQRNDPRQGLQDLEDLAELGSIASMIHVGWAYLKGHGVPMDLERADYWYRRATEAGSLEGSFRLAGLCRTSGRFDEALAAYSIGESQNFPASLYWLGRMYFNGMGVERDRDKAADLWRRASAMGHPFATRNLAGIHLSGRYGVGGIFKAVVLWLAAIRDVILISKHDPHSDLFR